MTIARLARPLPLLAVFGLGVSFAAAAVVRTLGAGVRPELLANALTVDLLVTVPAVYWFLAVRGAGWPRISVLPVVVLGSVAVRALPGLERGSLAAAAEWVAIPAELLLLSLVARRAVAAGRDLSQRGSSDALEALRRAAGKLVEVERAADLIAYEAAILWYALSRAPRVEPAVGEAFGAGGRRTYGAVLAGLFPVLVAESAAVHFFVRHWSPLAAWLLTGLGVYAALWLVGDFRALGRRRIVVTDEALHLRVGLRWTARIPLTDIRAAGEVSDAGAAPGPDHLRAVVLGPERQVVELRRPVEVVGLYGIRRRVHSIGLAVDEPERFLETLRRRIVPPDSAGLY